MAIDETMLPSTQQQWDDKQLLAEALGMPADRAERFAITDDKSDSWYVRRVVFWQSTIDNTAAVARSIIQFAVSSRDKLIWLYEKQHIAHATPKLVRNRKTYEDPLLQGITWFAKTGGWRIADNKALTDYVKTLDSGYYTKEQLYQLLEAMKKADQIGSLEWASINLFLINLSQPHEGVRVKIEPVKAYWMSCVQAGEVVPGYEHTADNEHGKVVYGTTEKWTLKKSLDRLKATVNKAIGWNPNDDDEGESDGAE